MGNCDFCARWFDVSELFSERSRVNKLINQEIDFGPIGVVQMLIKPSCLDGWMNDWELRYCLGKSYFSPLQTPRLLVGLLCLHVGSAW